MTLRQIVMELIARGHHVSYYVRNDGGLVITKIDNNRYSGKTGNAVARDMLGVSLSERRKTQLERINIEAKKIKKGQLKKTSSLPQEVEELWKKLTNEYRKVYEHATITKRQVLQLIEEKGVEGALDYLKEQERRVKGLAYNSIINGLIARLEEDKYSSTPEEQEKLDSLIEIIKANIDNISFDSVFRILDELYHYEDGSLSIDTFVSRVRIILKI